MRVSAAIGAAVGATLGAIASAKIRNTAAAHAATAISYNAVQTAASWAHLPAPTVRPTYAPTYVGAAWIAFAAWPSLGATIGKLIGSQISSRELR